VLSKLVASERNTASLSDLCIIFNKNTKPCNENKNLSLHVLILTGLTSNAQFKKYTFGLKAAPQIAWMKANTDDYQGNGAK
jgi:hypothetical protein